MKKPVRPSVYKKKSATPPANAAKVPATPTPVTPSIADEPGALELASTPVVAVEPASALIRVAENRSFTVWTRHLTAPGLGGSPAVAPSGSGLIRLPGRQFTIWTKPEHVRPVPMRNAPAESAVEPVAATMTSVTPAAPVKAEPCCRPWPLAAAALVMAGLLGFVWLKTNEADRQAEATNSELAEIRAQSNRANTEFEQAKQRLEAEAREIQTKLDAATAENTRLTQEAAALRERSQNAATSLTAQTQAVAQANAQLSAARQETAAARAAAAASAEDAAQAKRLAAGQEVQYRETISRLEAEKAAAVKAAAAANTELNALKTAPR